MDNDTKPPVDSMGVWEKILSALGSPLQFFGLTVLVCNTVFGVAAASVDAETFKYCIHMFLAIVGAFFLIALWSPRSLYHPKELVGIEKDEEIIRKKDAWIATLFLVLALVIYMCYQIFGDSLAKMLSGSSGS